MPEKVFGTILVFGWLTFPAGFLINGISQYTPFAILSITTLSALGTAAGAMFFLRKNKIAFTLLLLSSGIILIQEIPSMFQVIEPMGVKKFLSILIEFTSEKIAEGRPALEVYYNKLWLFFGWQVFNVLCLIIGIILFIFHHKKQKAEET